MSASKEWTEWHLTPKGWERGSERVDYSGVNKKEPPENRLLTKRFHERMSSAFSPIEKTLDELWSSGETEKINTLINEFGECPNSL